MKNKLIGMDPNQIPLNSHLGTMARQDHESPSVGELTVYKSFEIRRGNNYGTNDYPVHGSGNDTRPIISYGRISYIKNGETMSSTGGDTEGGSNKILIEGVRKAPSSGSAGATSPIRLLKFHYYAPYRATVSIDCKYCLGADGNYSSKVGESYYVLRNYNNAFLTEVKTSSEATTRNPIDIHHSTGTHHIKWLEFEPDVTSGWGFITLEMHGSGSQWGGYDIGFSMEITNLPSSQTGNNFGLQGLAID